MNLVQLEREIPNYFRSGLTPEIIGPPGVGKSDTVHFIKQKMEKLTGTKWGFSTFMIATSTPVHAMGYMVPSKTEIGIGENKRTALRAEYTLPGWMFTDDTNEYINDFEHGIVFLDEWDKGDADTKKALAPLILSRRVGPHRLHKNIYVIVASNRASDRSGSTKTFDFIINRRGAIEVHSDFTSWEQWAFRRGLEPIFIMFAKKYAQSVFTNTVPRDQGPFCTPRSFVAGVEWLLSRQEGIQEREGAMPPKYGLETDDAATIQAALGGIMGEGVATSLTQWLRLRQDTPDILEIVADPDGTKVPERPDARTLVAYECGYHINKQNVGPICRYMSRFPKDLQVTFATYAVRRDNMLLVDPHMDVFVKSNVTLMQNL